MNATMTLPARKPDSIEADQQFWDITHNQQLISCLKDVTPSQMGKAVSRICTSFVSMGFGEIVLSPFTTYPIDYQAEVIDVPGIGQLRFNTEPEIWERCNGSDKFFSTSTLFRREKKFNLLRRPAFSIIDFYQPGTPDSMLTIFWRILEALVDAGSIEKLCRLPLERAQYDVNTDGPLLTSHEPRWVLATDYDAAHSFFEVDEKGGSTRCELFLVTPNGFLEVAALGIVGWNRNPDYSFRCGLNNVPSPSPRLSGMGFGLERLLLAEQILSAAKSCL